MTTSGVFIADCFKTARRWNVSRCDLGQAASIAFLRGLETFGEPFRARQ